MTTGWTERPGPGWQGKGSTREWRKKRANQLAEYPDCADCGEIAVTVDHEIGKANDPHDEYLASLCYDCHAKRTNQQSKQVKIIGEKCGNNKCNCPPPRITTNWYSIRN